jgi:hypothetical protein
MELANSITFAINLDGAITVFVVVVLLPYQKVYYRIREMTVVI